MLPAATAAHAAAKPWRTLLASLWRSCRGNTLANNDRIALLQLAFNYLGRRAIRNPEFDPFRLWLFVRTENPDDTVLSREDRRAGPTATATAAATASSALRIPTSGGTGSARGTRSTGGTALAPWRLLASRLVSLRPVAA
jgi:hypothetical protein